MGSLKVVESKKLTVPKSQKKVVSTPNFATAPIIKAVSKPCSGMMQPEGSSKITLGRKFPKVE